MGNIEELINKLAQDTVTMKPAPHPYLLSLQWLAGAVAYLIIVLMFSGVRPDLLAKLHEPLFVAELAALSGILVASSLSASLLSFPDVHQLRRIAFAPLLTVALFLAVMFLAWQADYPPAPLPMHSFGCTLSISLMSFVPAVWIFYIMQKFASTHAQLAGCCALLFAFSTGAIWLRLYEVNNSIMHVIEWHYLPMIAFGMFGLWLGKAMLKW